MRHDPVKSEAEGRQEKCLHRLEELDPEQEKEYGGFKWRCVKCDRHMYRKNGVVVKTLKKEVLK